MNPLWINGEFTTLEKGTVSVEERGLLFGEGIYEVIAAYDGVPVLLAEHLDRWERSASGIRLDSPYTRAHREEVIAELIRRVDAPRASIYGQLSRGPAPRAHAFPATETPTELWFAKPLPLPDTAKYEQGVSAITHPDERWPKCWIKSTSLLPNVLAKQAAVDAGAFEAIQYREDGTVTEASIANFHMVKDGAIHTHPADGRILAGCKRAFVLAIAREIGITVHEHHYDLEFLRTADEAFLTSTTINALPVTRIDDTPVGTGAVGPILGRLMPAITERLEAVITRAREAS